MARLTGIQGVPYGMKITFTGSAGYTYQIECAALQNSNTVSVQLGSATTDDDGRGESKDLNPAPGQDYCRVVAVQESHNERTLRPLGRNRDR